jgi:hypothetical protein
MSLKREGKIVIDDDTEVIVTVRYGRVFAIVVIIMLAFELLLLGIGFLFADKVECNLLWCTFTTVRSTSTTITDTTVNIQSKCIRNGVPIDCKELTGGR